MSVTWPSLVVERAQPYAGPAHSGSTTTLFGRDGHGGRSGGGVLGRSRTRRGWGRGERRRAARTAATAAPPTGLGGGPRGAPGRGRHLRRPHLALVHPPCRGRAGT